MLKTKEQMMLYDDDITLIIYAIKSQMLSLQQYCGVINGVENTIEDY